MSRIRTFLCLIVLACLGSTAALAQRVYWDPPGGRLGLGKVERVSLVFEDCSPASGFELPTIPGLDFSTPSESQQTSVINFQMSTRVVLTYPVRAQAKGSITIPAFDALTNKGKIAVGEVRFDVGEAGVGPSGVSIGEIVSSQIKPARTTLWAGEVVDLEYLLTASSRYNVSLAGEPEWKPANVVLEPFGQGERVEATVGNERRQAARYRTRGLFTEPGQLTLEPVRQLVNVQTGERAVGFFSQPRMEQFTVESNTPAITVRALPQPAPDDFTGAVGSFTLESTIVPRTARIGEPITWTLTLSGPGNWTSGLSLPAREVSADFQVVQPKTRTEMESGQLFQGRMVEDAVLVPTAAGSYSLGPVALTYFDTRAGEYRTQTVPAVTVQIDPVPAGYQQGAPQHATQPPSTDESTPPGLPGSQTAAPIPDLPQDLAPTGALPGDPLPVGTSAASPRRLTLLWLLVVAGSVPILCWIGLASAQAIRTASTRERRLALRELRQLLRGCRGRTEAIDAPTLERWRTLAARVWAIHRATPTAEDLAAALAATPGASRPEDWLELWREAELAMFSPQATLPPTWLERAVAAARSTRIRAGLDWLPRHRTHWAPQAGVLALVIACAGSPELDASEARDAYRAGRFADAHDAWVAHLGRQPDDWAAHYNIALAAAQTDAWAEANAHATAALLLNPRSPEVRRQLRLAATHLDGVDTRIRRLLNPEWHDHVVFWLSPGEWQNLLVGGIVVDALALLTLIIALYLRSHRAAVRAAGQAMVVVGTLVVGCGFWALHSYGPLADPQVAMVVQPVQLHSIPSEIAAKQKSVPIAPGTIVTIDRSFLGWDRVRAGGDVSGWLRREARVPFFLAAPADQTAAR